MGKRGSGRILVLLMILALAGCRRVEFAGIRRVAVLSPDNYTSCSALPGEIKKTLLRVLVSRLAAEVVDGVMIERELPVGEYATTLLRPEVAAEFGTRYGVDAFLVGTVTTYREDVEKHLDLQAGTEERLKAEIRVDLLATVGFNLVLIRAGDGGIVFSRYAEGTAVHPLTLGFTPPSISLHISAEPVYPRLREEAIERALHGLLHEVARDLKSRR